MKCLNPHCAMTGFAAIINTENGMIHGVRCMNCSKVYDQEEIKLMSDSEVKN